MLLSRRSPKSCQSFHFVLDFIYLVLYLVSNSAPLHHSVLDSTELWPKLPKSVTSFSTDRHGPQTVFVDRLCWLPLRHNLISSKIDDGSSNVFVGSKSAEISSFSWVDVVWCPVFHLGMMIITIDGESRRNSILSARVIASFCYGLWIWACAWWPRYPILLSRLVRPIGRRLRVYRSQTCLTLSESHQAVQHPKLHLQLRRIKEWGEDSFGNLVLERIQGDHGYVETEYE